MYNCVERGKEQERTDKKIPHARVYCGLEDSNEEKKTELGNRITALHFLLWLIASSSLVFMQNYAKTAISSCKTGAVDL